MSPPTRLDSDKYVLDSLSAYRELMNATGQGLNSGRLIDPEHSSTHRDNLQVNSP